MSWTEAEQFLLDWHARHPGETSKVFADLRDSGGLGSYERLAALARPGDEVLDLCCGDGYLLELLGRAGVTRRTGLDMSPEELGAARVRLGEGVRLVSGRAAEMPFEDASFDLVTCHLAFMLLNPVEPVVEEVRRVLRPGGLFGAVVGGPGDADDPWGQLMGFLRELPMRAIRLGDRRTYSEQGLVGLLAGWEQVRTETWQLHDQRTVEQTWALFESMYTPEMMEAADIEKLRAFFDAQVAPRAEGGVLRFVQGCRMILGRRPASP